MDVAGRATLRKSGRSHVQKRFGTLVLASAFPAAPNAMGLGVLPVRPPRGHFVCPDRSQSVERRCQDWLVP